MSFQGDVAGLGLGELLQGLARGGREGVLTLRGGALSARLGVQEGQILLLPEEDEDPEIWRKRSERAWIKDPDQRIDKLRMREIAFAARTETMFQLLDCEGVHFRFEPGPLPDLSRPPARRASTDPNDTLQRPHTGSELEILPPITCPPIGVESLLLEYARLKDEQLSHPEASRLDDHLVPCQYAPSCPQRSFERLWAECDGMSNLREIGDRLGWPIRQVRGMVQSLLQIEAMYLLDAPELLLLAQRELQAGEFARAAARFAGWCRVGSPGPANPGDVELLLGEWERGKLPAAIAHMAPRDVRTLLRRVELVQSDPTAALARWRESRKFHRHDSISEVRTIHWQDRSTNEADAPAVTDLLRVARKFHEVGAPWRAGIVLRLAAARNPDTLAVRLEIGQRMVAVGLVEEGATFVVSACRALIEAKQPDRAIAPLRQLLQASPGQREARALIAIAHGKSSTGRRARRNSIVVLASILMLALVAVVKIRVDQDFERRFEEVQERIDDADAALALLDRNFGRGEDNSRVVSLRTALEERIENRHNVQRSEWIGKFQECQLETTGGDPVLGLRSALALPPPPKVPLRPGEDFPEISYLLDGLLERLQQTLAEWGDPTEDRPDAAHSEQRLASLVTDLRAVIGEAPSQSADLRHFAGKLESLSLTLEERSRLRAKARETRARKETFEQLDQLLASARAHSAAGDLARAVECYDQLTALPGAERLKEILDKEIVEVRAHHRAVVEARGHAASGRHDEALEGLAAVCPNPSEHLLPCRIDSLPSGARVRFRDGSSRVTPFVLEAAPGEKVALELQHEGYESETVFLEEPRDQTVLLSRTPRRHWRTKSPVEAIPVSVEGDHIVCDRGGNVARLTAKGDVAWTRRIPSLGGIARTPVFLARRAGSLLAVTEEGAAWIVEAPDGRLEGPWTVGAPPISGPDPTAEGVRVRFRDGHELVWAQRLKPESENKLDPSEIPPPTRGHDAGLAVLRRSHDEARSIDSPWSDWKVTVTETHFVVRSKSTGAISFAARRKEQWHYVAWEAPTARLPNGQLWISDGAGLRAIEP